MSNVLGKHVTVIIAMSTQESVRGQPWAEGCDVRPNRNVQKSFHAVRSKILLYLALPSNGPSI